MGRRIHKSGTGVTETYYVIDGADDIAEYNGAGSLSTRYIPGPAVNEPVAQVPVTGTRRFYFPDHHGSIIAATNNAGTVIEGPYAYDDWGNCFTTGGASCPTATAPFRFVGMRYDVETGLYYDRARYYAPVLGRFMQVDPVGYSADLNLYTYVNNDPNDKTDPSGKCFPVCTAAAGALIGGAIGVAAYLVTSDHPTATGALANGLEGALIGGLAGSGVGLPTLVAVGGTAHVAQNLVTATSEGKLDRYGKTTSANVKTVVKDFGEGAVETYVGGKAGEAVEGLTTKIASRALSTDAGRSLARESKAAATTFVNKFAKPVAGFVYQVGVNKMENLLNPSGGSPKLCPPGSCTH